MLKTLEEVVGRIKDSQKVLVIGHIKPDGDDVSSVATMVNILRQLGKTAEGCIDDSIPWFYKEIPGVDIIRRVEELKDYKFDTAITVDASEISRIGNSVSLLKDGKVDITLDHHKTNVGFGEYDFYDSSYAATAVVIYEIAKMLNTHYDDKLATLNLLGIATDTGFFKYSNTDYKVFTYAAQLTKMGANIQKIASAILEHKTLKEIKLQSDMINTLSIEENGKLAWAYISTEMFERNNCTDEDAGGFVSEIRALYGVEVAMLFIEWPKNQVNISFRSKNYVDVSEIATFFGGGGHARAAGCSCKEVKLHDMIGKVVEKAKEIIKKYE